MNDFYTEEELKQLGLKNYGKDVFISKKASIYGAENISIGNNVRIDDFCILSGNIEIGNFVHISAYSALYGKYGIKIGNFCGISPRSILFSVSDDFSGNYMISPMVPEKYTNVSGGVIILNNYVQIGANSIIMPSVEFFEGAVCGAFSFVKENCEPWSVYAGIPAKKIKSRNNKAKNYGKEIIDSMHNI